MTLKFHGIPVNPRVHPGEDIMKELAGRTIYRLDEVLNSPEELEKVKWLIGFNDVKEGQLNIEWADGVVEITPDGIISHETISSHGRPNLYLILHDDNFVPPWCTQVNKIEIPLVASHLFAENTKKTAPNPEQEKQEQLQSLKRIFSSHPETKKRWYLVNSFLCRFIHGVEKDEELYEGEYMNGDLVMEFREAIGEIVTTILDLEIIDMRSWFSAAEIVSDEGDLRFRLKVMDEQRKIESERRGKVTQ